MQKKRKQLWNTHEKNGEKMETTMDKKPKNYGKQMEQLWNTNE